MAITVWLAFLRGQSGVAQRYPKMVCLPSQRTLSRPVLSVLAAMDYLYAAAIWQEKREGRHGMHDIHAYLCPLECQPQGR